MAGSPSALRPGPGLELFGSPANIDAATRAQHRTRGAAFGSPGGSSGGGGEGGKGAAAGVTGGVDGGLSGPGGLDGMWRGGCGGGESKLGDDDAAILRGGVG